MLPLKPRRWLILDYETRSRCDLKARGAWEYSLDPSTEIICAAWKIGTKDELANAPVQSWNNLSSSDGKAELVKLLKDESVIVVAHNAFFERAITMNVLGLHVPLSRWICTAARASALALPRSLEGACLALNLPVQKDMEGRRLILKYCKPRKETKHNKDKWHNNPDEIERLVKYCRTDVEAETLLFLATPPLPVNERRIWELDQKMNFEGVRVDVPLVTKTLELIEIEKEKLNAELVKLSNGELYSATQREAFLNLVNREGAGLVDLTAKTVLAAINSPATPTKAKRLLEIRRDISRTSTAKYKAFEQRANPDDWRARDLLLYHGASTGRWAGRGVQPQNFPRGSIKNTTLSCEIVRDFDLDGIRLLYGNPMEVFASNLRGCIIPTEGYVFYCGDFAAIEVRVLFWLAAHETGLEIYRQGRDLYREMAAFVYRVKLADITKDQRQIGKILILGAGYGLGAKKFPDICENFGAQVDDELSEIAIKAYREMHAPVVKLWNATEQAAISAVRNPGHVFKAGKVKWFVENGYLWAELPSKRRLAYYGPEIRFKPTPWGEKKATLYHWSVNALTNQWECAGTYGGRLTENCCASNTLVLTNRGWVPIAEVQKSDLVFDGEEWVSHEGVICQGEKKTGTWLGVRLTGDHLILVGKRWLSAQLQDAGTASRALNSARGLVPWWLRNRGLVQSLIPKSFAIAIENILVKREACFGVKLNALNVDTQMPGASELNTCTFSGLKPWRVYGRIATRAWFLGVVTRIAKRMSIMVLGVLEFLSRGLKTELSFSSMQKHCRDTMLWIWNWIESITKKGTSPEISASYLEPPTRETVGIPAQFFSRGLKWGIWFFGKSIARSGKATMPLISILREGNPPSKLWTTTEKPEKVYDLVNCGPRSRFMIRTDCGPIIVHNCTQAVARDFMAESMLRLDANGYQIVLTVHDEILAEKRDGSCLDEFKKLMSALPVWGEGCPIASDVWSSASRYRKG